MQYIEVHADSVSWRGGREAGWGADMGGLGGGGGRDGGIDGGGRGAVVHMGQGGVSFQGILEVVWHRANFMYSQF